VGSHVHAANLITLTYEAGRALLADIIWPWVDMNITTPNSSFRPFHGWEDMTVTLALSCTSIRTRSSLRRAQKPSFPQQRTHPLATTARTSSLAIKDENHAHAANSIVSAVGPLATILSLLVGLRGKLQRLSIQRGNLPPGPAHRGLRQRQDLHGSRE